MYTRVYIGCTGCTAPMESHTTEITIMAGITKRNGTWYATWKRNGITAKKSTGIPVGSGKVEQRKNQTEAQRIADSMEAAAKGQPIDKIIEAVRTAAEISGTTAKIPTVREYLASVPATSSQNSELNRKRAFKVFIAYLGTEADKRLDLVSYNTCREFIREQLHQVSKKTVEQYHTYIKRAFADAQDIHAYISRNPMRPVSVAQEAKHINPDKGNDKQEREAFTSFEMHRLLTEAPRPWRDMVAVSFYTGGLRIGDVALMKWESIDWNSRRITLLEEKTRRMRTQPIIPALLSTLQAIYDEQGGKEEYVFPVQAHLFLGGSRSTVSTAFTNLLQSMGICAAPTTLPPTTGRRRRLSSKSFHSIRHTVVSMLRVNSAFTADSVRDTVGHTSEEVERGYFHGNMQQRETVLNSLSSIMQTVESMPTYDTQTA